MSETYGAERGLSRFEGFTDAVFAIALTLLIVEIKPPGAPDGHPAEPDLIHAVMAQWREHLALVLCFVSIGVYWLQHHFTGRIYRKSDHVFGLINLGFLLAITVLPYPLRIWCFHVGTGEECAASIALTMGLLAPAVFWMGKWLYALPHRRIVDERLSSEYLRNMTRRYAISTLIQALAVPLAFFAPRTAVALSLGVVVFFMLPPPKPRYHFGQTPTEEERTAD